MNVPAVTLLYAKTLTSSAIVQACPIGNGNHSKTIGDDGATSGRRRNDRAAAAQAVRTCQNETDQFAPLWNGPRLRPAFVAQVIGQVLMNQREQASGLARVAYDNGAPKIASALLLDARI
jgi:tRNA G26 N,N-dimethylase Trm1